MKNKHKIAWLVIILVSFLFFVKIINDLRGDINLDNKVSTTDLVMLRNIVETGKIPQPIYCKYGCNLLVRIAADVNGDFKIDEKDLELLRYKLAN